MKSRNSLIMLSVFCVLTLALVIGSDGLVRGDAQVIPDTIEVREELLTPREPIDNMIPIDGWPDQNNDGRAAAARSIELPESQDMVATPVLMVWRGRATGQWMSRQIEPGVKQR